MSTIRYCSHCHKALTDAVSLEIGVGPVCRGIENEVLAKTIPVDEAVTVSTAQRLLLHIGAFAAETQETMMVVFQTILSADRPSDLRATVKRLDWCLSFAQTAEVRDLILRLVRGLGYVGLAGILAGQSSTTPATITAVAGRIVVKGSKNSYAASLFKKIPGWKFSHPTKEWSFPATAGTALALAVATAYPATATDVAAVAAVALTQVVPETPASAPTVAAPAPVAVPQVVMPVPTMGVEGGKLIVRTPFYNPGFVSALKALPWPERAWDMPAAPKAWTVDPKHTGFVRELIAIHFTASKAA